LGKYRTSQKNEDLKSYFVEICGFPLGLLVYETEFENAGLNHHMDPEAFWLVNLLGHLES